jgi:replicative DNA helicase
MNKYDLAVQNEQYFLGCILSDPSLLDETVLSPNHFIYPQHKELFKTMLSLKKQGEEVSLVALTMLGESTIMKIGGVSYLSQLMNSVPSVHGFKSYEKNILAFYTVQTAINYANEFLEKTKETHKIQDLTQFISEISKLEADTVAPSVSFKDKLYQRVQQHLSSNPNGLSGTHTGFLSLNQLTDGWQPGDLIVIGARPSMGKTAFALNSALNACKKANVKVTFFSIEMTEEAIIDRLIATEGKINLMKLRNINKHFTDSEHDRYQEAVGRLESLDIDIREKENTVPAMRAVVRRNIKAAPDKKHVVMIDYLTLIKATESKPNRHTEVEEIVLELKQMAKDFNVPVIVLSQLSRLLEQRKDKRPMLSDLRESGAIEQAADMVMFLYRDDYYDPESEHKGITELLIAKNRNGKTGTLMMRFFKETNTFTEVLR